MLFGRTRQKGSAAGASPSPPTFVGVTAYADANGTTATPDASGLGLAANDILIAHCHLVSASDGVFASAPAGEGWTRKQDKEDTGGNNSATSIFWKRWGSGSTDDSTPSFTAAAGSLACVLTVWRGCKTSGDPLSTTAGVNNGSSGTTITGGSATVPGTPGCAAQVFMAAVLPASNVGAPSGSGVTSAYSGGSYATTAGSDRGVAAAYVTPASAGAFGASVTATAGATMTAWSTVTVVIEGTA